MIRILRSPSPALIVSLVALVAALSGVAVAGVAVIPFGKAPSTVHACVESKSGKLRVAAKCRKGERGIDLQAGADVKPLEGAQGPRGDGGPKGDQGPPGPSTGPAGGDLSGSYPDPSIRSGSVTQAKLAVAEAWHEVGTLGEPPFQSPGNFGCPTTPLWQNNNNFDNSAAFYRDPYGIVHLKGVVKGGVIGCAIFVLPQGYRPGEGYSGYSENQPVISNGTIGSVWIIGNAPDSASGSVIARSGSSISFSLDGVSFRCGPRGSFGCP